MRRRRGGGGRGKGGEERGKKKEKKELDHFVPELSAGIFRPVMLDLNNHIFGAVGSQNHSG